MQIGIPRVPDLTDISTCEQFRFLLPASPEDGHPAREAINIAKNLQGTSGIIEVDCFIVNLVNLKATDWRRYYFRVKVYCRGPSRYCRLAAFGLIHKKRSATN